MRKEWIICIIVILLGSVIDVNLEHPANAPELIEITVSGIIIEVNPVL